MTKMCMELAEIIVKRNVHGTMKGDVSCDLIQQGVSLTVHKRFTCLPFALSQINDFNRPVLLYDYA